MKIKKSQYQSGIITAVVALLLLLFLIYCKMTAERNEMDEGVMVAFGNLDDGIGQQPPAPEEVSSEASSSSTDIKPQPTPQQPSVNDKLITQEDPSVVMERERKRQALEAERERLRQEAAAEKARKEAEEKKAKASSLTGNAFSKIGSGSGTGEGDGKAGNPVGQGSEGGNKWSLNGRDLQGKLALPRYSNNEEGTIVVNIRVDASGKVIDAHIAPKGTTITSKAMHEEARKAALKNTFSKGNGTAVGTITYKFVLN
ncbi:MAG: energy transducer TonB [bacterium]|nr:energy transducer TonB [Candidatus Minthenecus merdequi]